MAVGGSSQLWRTRAALSSALGQALLSPALSWGAKGTPCALGSTESGYPAQRGGPWLQAAPLWCVPGGLGHVPGAVLLSPCSSLTGDREGPPCLPVELLLWAQHCPCSAPEPPQPAPMTVCLQTSPAGGADLTTLACSCWQEASRGGQAALGCPQLRAQSPPLAIKALETAAAVWKGAGHGAGAAPEENLELCRGAKDLNAKPE